MAQAQGTLVPRWDIFCAVVDNYGDIGVCWRLAVQLAGQGIRVRLWLDMPETLQALCPQVDPSQPSQTCQGIEIRHWLKSFPDTEPADVVIEAFACELPPSYLAAMAAQALKPVWINLEYLTAEPWAAECHGMASPHPQLPLTKYFYFPGFTEKTGGLLRQENQAQAAAELAQKLALPARQKGELRVSLFGYENPGVANLLQSFAQSAQAVTCLLPVGKLLPQVAEWLQLPELGAGQVIQHGNLNLRVLPFIPQPDYDALLWHCDINFVRGEDSFVRAQWAAKPFIWHIYPQPEDAHLHKLNAFLALYCQGLPATTAEDLTAFWHAWNAKDGQALTPHQWASYWQHQETLNAHAQQWAEKLAQLPDLATGLVNFCMAKLNKNGL